MTDPVQITPHFSLAELTRSSVATAHGLDNTPNEEQLENIKATAARLEKIRACLGQKYQRSVAIRITSCFRSPAVNRAAGGSPTSAHLHGSAADIRAGGLTSRQLAEDIVQMRDEGLITFDQLILEFPDTPGIRSWVHFGCRHRSAERNQVKTSVKRRIGGKLQTVYLEGLEP
ncbi:D-Ala-D-Ala carboxypeptidase family metallohydrolase [Eikenella sp. Marseille-P7795]|uniref:D-Ala-D-Ala carboxypeptidase family metallohydrolase n=1 Tax=Eikenella sp. Marseille-P7795 TaxID=2866577 RepID=UPI001CE3E67A|nr:D-Ala-D-Ala carboxypeptidase family metallohydrolase [Eikenella sp. Marseille-P7795]